MNPPRNRSLARVCERKLAALEALKKPLLHQAVSGGVKQTCWQVP